MSKEIIGKYLDVSACQGLINDKLNADGVILRLGYTGYGKGNNLAKDTMFDKFYNAYVDKYPIGIYWFTLAWNDALVEKETSFIINQLKGLKLELPIWIDVESQTHSIEWTNLSKTERTRLINKWLTIMSNAGYYVGIYANLDWLRNKLDMSVLSKWDVWVAQYYNRCTYSGEYGMWQYSSSEKADSHGLYHSSNCVDISNVYINYPAIIKSKGLNHLDEVKPISERIARPVLVITSKGVEVQVLQNNLNKAINSNLDCDGIFGKLTKDAVIEFQKKVFPDSKLEWDGIYGTKTYRKMIEVLR